MPASQVRPRHLGAFTHNVKLDVAAHTSASAERDGFTQVTDASGLLHCIIVNQRKEVIQCLKVML